MHDHAFRAQCRSAEHLQRTGPPDRAPMILFALALGTFAIGSGEFGSNGIIQLLATDLDVSVPVATYAVTAYALGVVIGSPILAIAAARLNRRTLLLALVVLFVVGNLLSAGFGSRNAGLRALRHRDRAGRLLRGGSGRGRLRLRARPERSGVRHCDGRPDRGHDRRIATGHLHRPERGLAGSLRHGRRRRGRGRVRDLDVCAQDRGPGGWIGPAGARRAASTDGVGDDGRRRARDLQHLRGVHVHRSVRHRRRGCRCPADPRGPGGVRRRHGDRQLGRRQAGGPVRVPRSGAGLHLRAGFPCPARGRRAIDSGSSSSVSSASAPR